MTRKTLHVAAAALVNADGHVLLAKRPEGRSLAGLWEFPGGKTKEGETYEHALIRELREELGISVMPASLSPLTFASHAYEDFTLFMPLFLCSAWEGTPVPREKQELAWVTPAALGDYPMPPADVPLIPLLRKLLQ